MIKPLHSAEHYCQFIYDLADRTSTSLTFNGGPFDAIEELIKSGETIPENSLAYSHLHRATMYLRNIADRIELRKDGLIAKGQRDSGHGDINYAKFLGARG